MEKILVTTDLSSNSIKGLCFAIQLSTQRKLQLIFFHVNKLWEDPLVPNPEHIKVLRQERENLQKEMNLFVRGIYKLMSIMPRNYKCIIYYNFGVVNSIIEYALHNNCSYICTCTHGVGNISKLLGTTAGNLITNSEVPVLCIPHDYQIKPITRLLYASDLANYEQELKKVVEFGKSIIAEVHMLHFSSKEWILYGEDTIEKEFQKKFNYNIALHLKKRDNKSNLLEEIDLAVAELSPSLLVMFTGQERTLFELLFFSSVSEKYSFRTKVPLLVFNKSTN